MAADTLALTLALWVAFYLRSTPHEPFLSLLDGHASSLPLALALYLILFASCRLYRYAWRFASLEMLWGIVFANTLGIAGLALLQRLLDRQVPTWDLRVLLALWIVSIVLVGACRILLRLANIIRGYGSRFFRMLQRDTAPTRAVILGCGAEGVRLFTALYEDAEHPYEVIGFLDDSPHARGIFVRGVRVLGPLTHLYDLLAEGAVDEVLIALPVGSDGPLRSLIMACRKRHVPVKVIPGLREVLAGQTRVRLEEVSVEDLLRRPPVRTNIAEIGQYVTGKRVLVTGAGGSIGSELCRQIMAMSPEKLILMGHGENSVFQIYQELVQMYPAMKDALVQVIASTADAVRIRQVFQLHRPHVLFHAAAHKHVPIMEVNVPEAIQNNVLGTQNVAEACGAYGVERMVLISTDKAVYPASVMGATKWLCEEVLRAIATSHPQTTYITVRFGNVLGSRGSVVPTFRDQIKRGGPVTVTHPEMTRYFMTIPEAVQLVLQAGAIGASGDLYLLDMGQPVRILDLAVDMIRLSGLEPYIDIPIVFTGLRPGERLYERLTTDEERLLPANAEAISIVHRKEYFTPATFRGVLRTMRELADLGDARGLLEVLNAVVPGFSERQGASTARTPVVIPESLPESMTPESVPARAIAAS